jgi:CRP/FNR family transcriptional regulator, dissimilatory nitrate respiration regulator
MFRSTPRPQLAELARAALTRQVPAGGPVLRRGERVPGLMVVQSGLVKISLKGDSERVLLLVGAGETFAEAPLFLGQPLQVDVTAVGDTALVIVPAAPLLALFDRDPRFARGLLAAVCQRLQTLVADFESATVHDAGERLAAYLGSLGKDTACLPAPKAVIASRLGMTKETLSRLLRSFMDQGLIEVAKREIRILDRARLSAAARSSASSRG